MERRFVKGQRLGAGDLNRIQDTIREVRPIGDVTRTPRGTHTDSRTIGWAARDYDMPFDIAGIAWGGSPSVPTVTLVEGDIEIHGESLSSPTTTYKTLSPLTVTLTGSGTEYVWISMTWSGSAWGTPVLATGASKPTDTDAIYKRLLWKFVAGVPSVQYHRGNIEAVGLRMQG
jgi:hypothetical protein